MEKLKIYFLQEPKPLTSKRDVNWTKVKIAAGICLITVIMIILFLPNQTEQKTNSYKQDDRETPVATSISEDPTQETLRQLQDTQNFRGVHRSLDYLYRPSSYPLGSGNSSGVDHRNSSMIISRQGDAKNQLNVGTRLLIRLNEQITVTNQVMPIIGYISKDITTGDGVAIAVNSKVIGDASFDETSERVTITWKSIIFESGTEKQLSAIAVGRDGQLGIDGRVKSNGFKNAIGETVAEFIGAYGAGSMNTGVLGANEGGHVNGIRAAISETARNQAKKMGEDLKKEKKWIELESNQETIAVLNQPFNFITLGDSL